VAEPANLRLLEAAAFVADRRQIQPNEARSLLLRRLQDGGITARGDVPLNAHRDADLAWRLCEGRASRGNIPASAWFVAVDWTRGHVGRYRHVTIAETNLAALFSAQRRGTRPVADAAVGKAVKDCVALAHKDQKPTSQIGCLAYMGIHLPGATRAQILHVYRNLEPPKPRGSKTIAKRNNSDGNFHTR
jgi:hypothetical protein